MRGDKLVKLIKTIDLISGRRGATVEQIAEELEVSKRTAYRFLSVVEELGFLIEDIKDPIENRTRKRLDSEFHQQVGPIRLPDIKFNPSEIIALYLLKSEATSYTGTNFADNIESAFAKIGLFVPKGVVEQLDKLKSLFLADRKMAKSLSGKEDIVDQLIDAMLANQTCYISYHSFHDDKEKSFKIDPLHFFEHQGGFYLFVNATSFGNIRILAAERIIHVTPTDETFTYPDDFDPEEKLKNAFGVICDDPMDLEIWFSANQARYIKERIWAVDQQIVDRDDGSIILKMHTSGKHELKKWILGYGAEAKVLQPEELYQEIRKEIRKLSKLY